MNKAHTRIIDNKRVLITEDEYKYYTKICRSYDAPNRKGEDLFKEHFDTNGEGIIIFVRPPDKRYSSLEVFCFLVSLMINQHLRNAYDQNQKLIEEATTKFKELVESTKKELAELKNKHE